MLPELLTGPESASVADQSKCPLFQANVSVEFVSRPVLLNLSPPDLAVSMPQ